jgi:hypothetical protein
MSPPEAVLAGVFLLAGIRSLVWWMRRPFESTDMRDQLLFASYLTGRVGMWFAVAGLFLLLSLAGAGGGAGASTGETALARFAGEHAWYVMVFLALGVMQFVSAFFLGRHRPRSR